MSDLSTCAQSPATKVATNYWYSAHPNSVDPQPKQYRNTTLALTTKSKMKKEDQYFIQREDQNGPRGQTCELVRQGKLWQNVRSRLVHGDDLSLALSMSSESRKSGENLPMWARFTTATHWHNWEKQTERGWRAGVVTEIEEVLFFVTYWLGVDYCH